MENILNIIIETVQSAFVGVKEGVEGVFGALKGFFNALFKKA